MDDSEATASLSTVHLCVDSRQFRHQNRVGVRHAMVVINRMIRSPHKRDQLLHDRIFRAAGVVRATDATETAVFSNRPADVVYRLASRIVRGLTSNTRQRSFLNVVSGSNGDGSLCPCDDLPERDESPR
ncbi:MAG: hypothetical protein GY758_14715 [Fuerstiella sp.]|jgi:hypothetical protein|nr:hypothetical protein [Fuerstiella sp.]MCP4506016.1 hypothetical protein [Fuerstiella sp.]MDG2131442.1 hypothetical protein [Fuerstiella sp.]